MENTESIVRIHAYLTGQLTDEEIVAFEHWRNASAHNESLFIEVSEVWHHAEQYEYPEFNSAEAIGNMPFATTAQKTPSVQVRPKRQIYTKWAVAASLVLAIGTWATLQFTHSTWHEIKVETTQIVSLLDGSDVYLGYDGVISFPDAFSSDDRTVKFEGEAYFDIERDESRPFIIETQFAEVIVLGTEFNVHEDENAETIEIHVTEGKVRLQPIDSDLFLDIEVGQSALFNNKTGSLQRNRDADMNELAWHTKRLLFAKTPIEEVFEEIEDAFDVQIDYSKSGISNCSFSSLFEDNSATEILESMSIVFGFRIAETSAKLPLMGMNCPFCNVFIDKKIPKQRRDNIPVIVSASGDIIWVAGLCASDNQKLVSNSSKILKLELLTG